MKFSLRVLLLTTFIYAPFAYSMEPGLGDSICFVDSDMNCRIAWDLSREPRTFYRLERFEPLLQEWAIEQNDVDASGIAHDPAKPGHIYRVLGCNVDGNGVETDCISTTVTWSPVIPTSADRIPERIFNYEGTPMRINKRMKLRTQTLQLNVYLMSRDLGPIDVSAFPRMAKVTWVARTTDEMIWDNVSAVYNGMIDLALGIPTDPGPLNPRVGYRHDEDHMDEGPLHPEGDPHHELDDGL